MSLTRLRTFLAAARPVLGPAPNAAVDGRSRPPHPGGADASGSGARALVAISPRYGRPVLLGVAILVGLWLGVYIPAALSGWTGAHIAWDFEHYLAGVRAWLDTGSPYDPRFVAAPYVFDDMAFVHPPIAILLFAPFLALPAPIWWIVPIGLVVWNLWDWRPTPMAWALILPLMALPLSVEALLLGNSSLWATAFVATGLRLAWPFALLVVKPTFLPLALIRWRDRRLWFGIGVVLLACLPFGALWAEWIQVLRHFNGPPAYTLYNLPLILVPGVGWLGRRQPVHERPGRTLAAPTMRP